MSYTPKTIPLKNTPEDVYKKLMALQAKEKEKCSCQKSLSAVVFSLIRKAHKELIETN